MNLNSVLSIKLALSAISENEVCLSSIQHLNYVALRSILYRNYSTQVRSELGLFFDFWTEAHLVSRDLNSKLYNFRTIM